MGVGSSTQQKLVTPQQQDVKYLGDRMPFGDEELHLIYRAYQARQQLSDKISFLTDMGVLTAAPPPGATNGTDNNDNHVTSERLLLLQAVEQKILPPNFGNRLNRTTFLRPQDAASNHNDYNDYSDGPVGGAPTNTNGDGEEDDYTRLARLEKFFDGLSNCGRRGAKSTLNVLVSCCEPQPAPSFEESSGEGKSSSSPSTTTWIKAEELVDLGYRIALASAFLQAAARDDEDVGQFFPSPPPQNEADGNETPDAIQALTNSLLALSALRRRQRQREAQRGNPMMMTISNEINPAADATVDVVNVQDVEEWAENVAPLFASSLATFSYDVFFPNRPYPPSRTSFDYPRISDDSTFFRHGSSPLLFSLGCMSSSLSGEFFRLYTSASDGLSFNRLQNALLGYGGPTLLIIQSDDCIFGAFTASSWKESKEFYGNTDCFLFQVLPTTCVYRPTGNDRNFMYCNSFARSRGYDQQAHGIGFGGTIDLPRLFIAESFDNCQASVQDMTFEKGALLSKKVGGPRFEIDNLEVWGVGGNEVVKEALGARSKQRDIRDAAIRKARKVDKAAFLDDFRSGMIESKAFAHRGQIQGREGACIDPDELKQKNYKYPET